MSNPRLTEIAWRHAVDETRTFTYYGEKREICRCGQNWPCDAAILVQRIERLEGAVKRLVMAITLPHGDACRLLSGWAEGNPEFRGQQVTEVREAILAVDNALAADRQEDKR